MYVCTYVRPDGCEFLAGRVGRYDIDFFSSRAPVFCGKIPKKRKKKDGDQIQFRDFRFAVFEPQRSYAQTHYNI